MRQYSKEKDEREKEEKDEGRKGGSEGWARALEAQMTEVPRPYSYKMSPQ